MHFWEGHHSAHTSARMAYLRSKYKRTARKPRACANSSCGLSPAGSLRLTWMGRRPGGGLAPPSLLAHAAADKGHPHPVRSFFATRLAELRHGNRWLGRDHPGVVGSARAPLPQFLDGARWALAAARASRVELMAESSERVRVCMHVGVCACVHVPVHMRVRMHVHTCVHAHVHTHGRACACVYAHVCMCAWMHCACVHVCLHA